MRDLAGHSGAVVALEPSTGRVRGDGLDARPTTPTRSPPQFARLNRPARGAPLLNRATQGLYAPGSTFKVITATAALESGKYTPADHHRRPRQLHHRADGAAVQRRRRDGRRGHAQRRADLLVQHRVRPGRPAGRLRPALLDHAATTASSATRRSTTRPTRWRPSGLYSNGHLLRRSAPVDVARVAIGQERLGVTPLQMAEVVGHHRQPAACACARRWSTGRCRRTATPSTRTRPEQIQRVMSPQTAFGADRHDAAGGGGGYRAPRRMLETCRSQARPAPPRRECPD